MTVHPTILMCCETTLLLSIIALYIVNCPFNKVEESFNTQAIHDIINIFPNNFPPTSNYSDSISFAAFDQPSGDTENTNNDKLFEAQEIAYRPYLRWDHTLFPGTVPRTFIGALVVALPMRFAKYLMSHGEQVGDSDQSKLVQYHEEQDFITQFILQLGSRFALASFFVLSLSILLRSIQKRYGLPYRLCFLIITTCQFHYLFYAGRFIPNSFAAILANLVFSTWINRQYSKAVVYIAICVVVFRIDTAIFFGWLLLDGIFVRRFLTLGRVLKVGIPAGLVSILLTVAIDSIFWGQLIWPEFQSLYFNVWLNKSHLWGVQPYFWYIYNCIPRLMMATAPLLLLAEHKFTRDYLIPTLAFLFTYSFLPHKELRFILFVTPSFNLCAASGLMNVYYYLNKSISAIKSQFVPDKINYSQAKISPRRGNRKTGSKQQVVVEQRSYIAIILFALVVMGFLTANLLACYVLVRVSSHNYPGGQAALSLGLTKELLDNSKESLSDTAFTDLRDFRSNVGVYVNNLAAQTGVSRFIQVNGAYYAKSTKLDDMTFQKSYDLLYLILEPKEVSEYLRLYCPRDKNSDILLKNDVNKFSQGNDELKCQLPNQSEMFCSIIDTLTSFRSVNIGAFLRNIKTINSIRTALEALHDTGYIKTQTALHTIRCSIRSKFNTIIPNKTSVLDQTS